MGWLRRLYWAGKIVGNDEVGYSATTSRRSLWATRRQTLLSALSKGGL